MAQTNFPSRSTIAVVYPRTIHSSSTIVCGLDGTKDSWIFRNAGDCNIYIKYGDFCNPVVYTQLVRPKALFADDYDGLITGCVDAGNSGLLLVTLKV